MTKNTSKTIYILILVCTLLFTPEWMNTCSAQNNKESLLNYSIQVDTNVINIGDQINLDIIFNQKRDLHIDFPIFRDSISSGIEIIDGQTTDTLALDSDIIRIIKRYKITSFDAGIHKIKPITFSIKNKDYIQELRTDTLFLSVRTMEIDTTKGPQDIIMPIDTPLNIDEIYPWIIKSLIALAILALIIALIFVYTRRKNEKSIFGQSKPIELAHLEAFRKLEALKHEKLCEKGLVKEYHSSLVDILKLYINRRFEVPSIESTSDELISLLKNTKLISKDKLSEMKFILDTADLAKFAKFMPLTDDNHKSYKLAYKFVEDTLEKDTNENNIEEKK